VPTKTLSDLLTLWVAGLIPIATMLHAYFFVRPPDQKRPTWMLLIPWRLGDFEIFSGTTIDFSDTTRGA
jgi:hypothetical protein